MVDDLATGGEAAAPILFPDPAQSAALDAQLLEQIAEMLEQEGYEWSPLAMRHYLGCSGAALTIPVDRLWQSEAFKAAEEELRNRIRAQVMRDTIDMIQCGNSSRVITRIDDGGEFTERGHLAFEYFDTTEYWKAFSDDVPTKDLFGLLGTANIRAIPDIRIWRSGDQLYLDGVVGFEMQDLYNFDAQYLNPARRLPSIYLGLKAGARQGRLSWLNLEALQALETYGHAKAFPIRTAWQKALLARSEFTDLLRNMRAEVVRSLRLGRTCGSMNKRKLSINLDRAFDWVG